MTPETLLYILAPFIIIGALALAIQALVLVGIYRSAKRLDERIQTLVPRVEVALDSVQRSLEESRRQFAEVTGKANQTLDLARTQLVRLDSVMADAATRAKAQMERVELVLDDTLGRVQETVAVLHGGILRPLREVNGLIAGVRAAIECFLRGRRPTVAQATHEDEMFI